MDNILVSLTSTSRRIRHLRPVILGLLSQQVPARVVLWLSPEPHLLDDGVPSDAIPTELRTLEGPRFSIRQTRNIGPYRKLLPARRIHAGIIVTADDDTLYPEDWLSRLLALHQQHPNTVCAMRAHRMLRDQAGRLAPYLTWTPWDGSVPDRDCFPTGKDGVLYPPAALDPRVDDEDALLELAPSNDDIWFKAAGLAANTLAVAPAHHKTFPTIGVLAGLSGLFARRNLAHNDEMLERVFEHFGITAVP